MASNKDDITTPDLHTLQASLSSLATAAHILDGFVHRNRNQHRGTRWWGPFDMLRRSVRKTLPDLEGAVRRAEVLSASAPSGAAKRRKTGQGGRAVAVKAKQPELERVEQRAQWMHDVAGAKAYEAFTQLAADRQFAQLGLALIGVLAQVEAAIAPFVGAGPEGDPAGEMDPVGGVRAAGTRGDGPLALAVLDPPLNSGDDLGVAISRDELDDDDTTPKDEDLPPPASSLRKQERSSKLKPELSRPEGALSREDKGPEPQRTGPKEATKDIKKKKKKKKKGGDEFDDLFSTLL